MRTIIIVVAIVSASICGCDRTVTIQGESVKDVRFYVSVDGDWTVTRSLHADGQQMTDLWLYDYMGNDLVGILHKTPSDADFGAPSVSMRYGEHTVCVVASRGKEPSAGDGVIEWQQPSDTFWSKLHLTIGSGDASEVSAVLERVATRLRIIVTDDVPNGVADITVNPSEWFYGLDVISGAAVIMKKSYPRVIDVPMTYIGTSGQLSLSVFGLMSEGDWQTSITIEAHEENGGVVGVASLDDVPFARNWTTTASGCLFSQRPDFLFSLDSDWLGSYSVDW